LGGVVSFDTADNFAQASVWGEGTRVSALAMSPDGTRLYILGEGRVDLVVIDLVSRQVLAQLPTGGGATQNDYPRLVAHPDGKHLFATGVHSGALTAISLADGGVLSIPVATALNDAQVSPDGRLVCVSCGDEGTAAVIDPVANVVKRRWDDSSRSSTDGFDITAAVGFTPDSQKMAFLRRNAGGGRLSLVKCAWDPLRQKR
jgi:DNA-binding beta-propeller fold protein YncE